MSTKREHEPVQRLDGHDLVAAIAAAGGPYVELIRPMTGGAVGAFLVRRSDGQDAVLTWSPPPPADADPEAFATARALMDLARSYGVPAPRYEDVIVLRDGGIAVLQQRLPGVRVDGVSAALVDRMAELAEMRHGLLAETPFAGVPCHLYLTASGPGFCHHEPLRHHNAATRELLTRIENTGAELGDSLDATDLVHFDYTLGNTIVDEHDPDRVTGIIDWDGARAGDLALDLVILRFDLSWRAPDLGERLERHLLDSTDGRTFRIAWAHASLRLVDWTIRHQPAAVDHWVALARRQL